MSDRDYMEHLLAREAQRFGPATPAKLDISAQPKATPDDGMLEASPEDRVSQLLAGMKTGEWLVKQRIPELQMLVPHILPEGCGLLIGPPKLGKSYLTLELALSVGIGYPFLSIPDTKRRPVFLLALEDSDRRVQSRAKEMGFRDALGEQFMYLTEIEEDAVNYAAAWLSQFGDTKPLVIVDTFRKGSRASRGRNESTYEFDYRVAGLWQSLAKKYPGCTILIVHHTRKMKSDDWMDGTLGSQGLNGAVDFTIRLEGKRGAKEAVLMGTGRDLNDFQIRLERADTGAWLLGGKDFEEASQLAAQAQQNLALSGEERAVYDVMQPGVEYGASDIVSMTGVDVKNVRVYLGRLADDGYIERTRRGVYMRAADAAGGDSSR